jgi:hypothetical protein
MRMAEIEVALPKRQNENSACKQHSYLPKLVT